MLQRGTNKDYIYNGSFHEAISPVLVMAQLFGVMPVCGIRDADLNLMEFKWKCFRTIYSLAILLGLLIMTFVTIYWTFTHKIEFAKIGVFNIWFADYETIFLTPKCLLPVTIIFYLSNFTAFVYFIKLGMCWPGIMRRWEQIDRLLPPLKTYYEKAALANKIKIVALLIMCLSLGKLILNSFDVFKITIFNPYLILTQPIKWSISSR